jgi:hypothetical protein
MRRQGKGGWVFARERALVPFPCNPHPSPGLREGLGLCGRCCFAARTGGARRVLGSHSPAPTAVSEIAAARLYAFARVIRVDAK